MPQYTATTRNGFRYPAGAANDPPDVPGYMGTLAADVDSFLGVGGAEYCASSAAMSAIPTSRRFAGKLVYRADLDMYFRWGPAGSTVAGGSGSTWQGWHKAPTAYTPTITNCGGTLNSTTGVTASGFYGISAGQAWATAEVVSASGYSIVAGTDVTVSTPVLMMAAMTTGRGIYYRGGTTNSGSVWDLMTFIPGPASNGYSSTFRVRAMAVVSATAGSQVSANQMGNVIPSPFTGDRWQVSASSPAGNWQ